MENCVTNVGTMARHDNSIHSRSTTNTSHPTFDRFLSKGDSIRRRRIRIQPESSQAALWTRVGQLFFFITEASHAYDRYCGAYVLDRNELNIERTYVIGSREREREKKRNVVRMERNLKFGSKNLTSITTIIWFEKSRLRYFVFNLWYVNFLHFFLHLRSNKLTCLYSIILSIQFSWMNIFFMKKNPKNANTSGYITIRI